MRALLEEIHTLAKLAEPIRPQWTPQAYDIDLLFLRSKNHLIRLRDSIELLIQKIPDNPPPPPSILVDENHEGG